MTKKRVWYVFFILVLTSLLTPLWVFKELLFPFITSKAFFFRILVEAALPCYIYLLLVDPKLRPDLKKPLNLAVIAFLVLNILTAFTGVNVTRSLWGNFERMGGVWYLAHLSLYFFYVQVIGQAGGIYLKRFLQTFVAVGAILSLNGISGWLGGPTLTWDPSLPGRVSSTFGNPIFFASFLIVPTFLASYLALLEKDRFEKYVYVAAVIFQVFGIFLSGTRGAAIGIIVAVFVAGVLYSFLVKKSLDRRYALIGMVTFLVIAGSLFALRRTLPHDSTLYRIVNLRDSNTQARLIQWRTALQGFKEEPWLGVGSENYYIVSNSHWDPQMYKYDPSWFDKPHNFLLEVLTTNGVFGLLAYIGIMFFAMYCLWKAYRTGSLALGEACVLLAGLLAYQVQNIFVFDTVSASMAIYSFLGVVAFKQTEALQRKKEEQQRAASPRVSALVLTFSIFLMFFLQNYSNFISMQAAKRANYGQTYSVHDPKRAAEYFLLAMSLKYNLDKRDTVNFYSQFVTNLVSTPDERIDKNFIVQHVSRASKELRTLAERIKNDPIIWMRLATNEMNEASLQGQSIEASKPAIDKAIALAPNRAELWQLKVQYSSYLLDWKGAEEAAKKIVEINPHDARLKWQLAMAYFLNGQEEAAVQAGDEALAQGHTFTQLQQFAWYIQHYQKKQDYHKVVALLERAVELEPNEVGLYFELAQAYAGIGDKDHARILARQVAASDPSLKGVVDSFIDSLK